MYSNIGNKAEKINMSPSLPPLGVFLKCTLRMLGVSTMPNFGIRQTSKHVNSHEHIIATIPRRPKFSRYFIVTI